VHLVGSSAWRPGGARALTLATRWIEIAQRLLAGWDRIRWRLVGLAVISTLPLVALVVVNAAEDLRSSRHDAQMEALRVAQLQADLIDEHLLAVDTLLAGLTPELTDRLANHQDADALLQGVMAQLPPIYTGLSLGPAATDVARTPSGLVVNGAPITPASGVSLGRAVHGPDGQVLGTLTASTRLDRLPRLETRDLPAGSSVMVLDERGRVLAHSPEYEVWVGRDLGDLGYIREALRRHQGSDELVSADGVSRLSAYASVTRAPWLVYVGLPSEIVLGSSRVSLLRNLWFGVLALCAAVLVAWVVAGRITEPLRRLAADASALGGGDLARRAHIDRRDEVGVLVAVFNEMAEDIERHVAELQSSQQREQEARLTAEAAARQIAEREKRLQDLVRQLQVAQEEERRRVAYEIHDGLAQVAASAHQHLQTFADYHAPESVAGRQALHRAVELVQLTVREARRLIAGLRPTALDDFGLGTAIRLEVESLRGEGWQVSYQEDLGDQRLPSTLETALFRVTQEALTNIRKHAGRAKVAVKLKRDDESVWLEVRDWGRGFSPHLAHERPRPGERVGLLSMQERVALLRGHCTVNSEPGAGTQVIAEVPLVRNGEA
jgi:signal transduction histidine kinase